MMMMTLHGNVEPGHNYTPAVRSVIFGEVFKERNENRYGWQERVKKRLRDDHNLDVPIHRLKKMRKKK
jgi:hypothetical protein